MSGVAAIPNFPTTTYLSRREAEIPDTPTMPSMEPWSATLYTVGRWTFIAVFISTVGATFAYVYIVAQPYVILVLLGCVFLQGPVLSWQEKLRVKAECCTDNAQKIAGIWEKFQAIKNEDMNHIYRRMHKLIPGLPYSDDGINRLKPLLARFDFWAEVEDYNLAKEIEEIRTSLDIKEDLEESVAHKIKALEYHHTALTAKVNQAFEVAMMRNPRFLGEPGHVVTLQSFNLSINRANDQISGPIALNSWIVQTLFNFFQDNRANGFMIFDEAANLPPITFREVAALSVPEIADRICAAIPNDMLQPLG